MSEQHQKTIPTHLSHHVRLSYGKPSMVRRALSPRRIAWALWDIIAALLAVVLTLEVRFDRLGSIDVVRPYLPAALLIVVVWPLVSTAFGVYSRAWQYASVSDFVRLAWAVLTAMVVTAVIFYTVLAPLGVQGTVGLPRSLWLGVSLSLLALAAGPRFARRAIRDWRTLPGSRSRHTGAPTLVFGAGDAGMLVARSALRESGAGVRPVGFLDDDPSRWGTRLVGLPVLGGLAHLGDVAAQTGASTLLITMPRAEGSVIRRVTEAALATGLQVRTVPGIEELYTGSLNAFRIRQVQVEDLLRREPVGDAPSDLRDLVEGRAVLVTGAGGSIGSELVRQLYALGPDSIVMLDRSEGALFEIEQELKFRKLRGVSSASTQLELCLADVADRSSMDRALGRARPDLVFHAAAYKHVPMMEAHPLEAVRVNIGGTLVAVDAALQAGVGRFVLVSTDKAVAPTSVMGMTKRIAELIVAEAATQSNRPLVSVRFGNVLGSSGSVVPLFMRQLEVGGPLTLTDPEMTRYFMTIPEAVHLILRAASIGTPGDLFVLDMGDPVRIVDLATDLIRLTGRDPEAVPIVFTGARPGEKLHERLFYDQEGVRPTRFERVLRAVDPTPATIDVRGQVQLLLDTLAAGDGEALRARLAEAVALHEVPSRHVH